MDTKFLAKCLKEIKVTNLDGQDVEVMNNSPLEMIGKGRQGAVFKVNDEICIKIFGNTEDCDREYYALSLGQKTSFFPKLYGKGRLYIAMEMIRGVDLREYLQSQPLTEKLSHKLIDLLITFKEIGFDRIDHHKRQIFIQPDGSLKVIDVARAVWRDRVYPYPRKLLNSLGEEYKETFLCHVKALSPELYREWEHYIKLENLSREIYHILLESGQDKGALHEVSRKTLLTKTDEEYLLKLENMMHKVFKEEWVKTMLAQGKDPDEFLDRIDEYLESKTDGKGKKDKPKKKSSYKERLSAQHSRHEKYDSGHIISYRRRHPSPHREASSEIVKRKKFY